MPKYKLMLVFLYNPRANVNARMLISVNPAMEDEQVALLATLYGAKDDKVTSVSKVCETDDEVYREF